MAERDFVGYGPQVFDPQWPGNKKLALQFVLNYEEGGESCVLNGDVASEHLLSDIVGAVPYVGQRHMNVESLYEYGSRTGFWRLHRAFTERNVPLTVFAVARALEENPQAVQAMKDAGWEVASHGYRWIDYQNVDKSTEREHIRKSVAIHEKLLGKRPVGMYQGKPNGHTRQLVVDEGGFLYDADAYNDDLPYWNTHCGRPHLVIPYALDTNDMKFVSAQGFNSGDQFYTYLKDAFDVLLEEGRAGQPKMMSVGLHCRVIGHPGRIAALLRFLDYVLSFHDVWICKREDIARHWYATHYPHNAATRAKL